jgi:hypothetical protein
MMIRRIVIFPLMFGLLACTAAADSESELVGIYACNGKNPDGSSYEAIVEIIKQDGTFVLQWFNESELVGVGLGIRSGDVLAVSYFSGLPGVVAYRIEDGNRLVGEWTVAGADGALFSETLTKMPPEALEQSGRPSRSQPRSPHDGERRRQRETTDLAPGAREL